MSIRFLKIGIVFLIVFGLSCKALASSSALFDFEIDGSDRNYVHMQVKPGQTFAFDIILTNRTDKTNTNLFFVSDAKTADNGGTATLTHEQAVTEQTGGWFVPLPKTVTLNAYEQKRVTVSGTVPSDAGVGDHMAVLYLRSTVQTGEETMATNEGVHFRINRAYARSCAVVFHIEGETHISYAVDERMLHRWVRQMHPVVEFHVQNQGNTYDYPKVELLVCDSNGSTVFHHEQSLDIVYPEQDFSVHVKLPLDRLKEDDYSLYFRVQPTRKMIQTDVDYEKFSLSITPIQMQQAAAAIQRERDDAKPPTVVLITERSLWILLFILIVLCVIVYMILKKRHQSV